MMWNRVGSRVIVGSGRVGMEGGELVRIVNASTELHC